MELLRGFECTDCIDRSNDIGNAGAAMLATGLQKNSSLRNLDLADNSISDRLMDNPPTFLRL